MSAPSDPPGSAPLVTRFDALPPLVDDEEEDEAYEQEASENGKDEQSENGEDDEGNKDEDDEQEEGEEEEEDDQTEEESEQDSEPDEEEDRQPATPAASAAAIPGPRFDDLEDDECPDNDAEAYVVSPLGKLTLTASPSASICAQLRRLKSTPANFHAVVNELLFFLHAEGEGHPIVEVLAQHRHLFVSGEAPAAASLQTPAQPLAAQAIAIPLSPSQATSARPPRPLPLVPKQPSLPPFSQVAHPSTPLLAAPYLLGHGAGAAAAAAASAAAPFLTPDRRPAHHHADSAPAVMQHEREALKSHLYAFHVRFHCVIVQFKDGTTNDTSYCVIKMGKQDKEGQLFSRPFKEMVTLRDNGRLLQGLKSGSKQPDDYWRKLAFEMPQVDDLVYLVRSTTSEEDDVSDSMGIQIMPHKDARAMKEWARQQKIHPDSVEYVKASDVERWLHVQSKEMAVGPTEWMLCSKGACELIRAEWLQRKDEVLAGKWPPSADQLINNVVKPCCSAELTLLKNTIASLTIYPVDRADHHYFVQFTDGVAQPGSLRLTKPA